MGQDKVEQYVASTLGGQSSIHLVRELVVRGVTHRVFAVENGASWVVVESASLQHFARDGMTDDDIEFQIRGEDWLRQQKAVPMLRPMDGETDELDYHEENRLEQMVEEGCPEDYHFLEGWILKNRGEFLAMGESREGKACVLSDMRESHVVDFPSASPFRRLSYVVGKHFSID